MAERVELEQISRHHLRTRDGGYSIERVRDPSGGFDVDDEVW